MEGLNCYLWLKAKLSTNAKHRTSCDKSCAMTHILWDILVNINIYNNQFKPFKCRNVNVLIIISVIRVHKHIAWLTSQKVVVTKGADGRFGACYSSVQSWQFKLKALAYIHIV